MKPQKDRYKIKKAIIFIVIAALSFSLMALFAKLVSVETKVNMIVFARFSVSFFYILMILGFRKIKRQKVSLKTNHIIMHFFRAILGLIAIGLLFIALRYIPIVEVNVLSLTSALFIPVIGALFLQTKTDIKHWVGIVIGFMGVAFILKPGLDLFNPVALLALLAGLILAVGMILLRRLSKYDNHYVIMFYLFMFVTLISGIISIFNWQRLDLKTIGLLLGVGVFGTFYQEFLTRATSYAPAKVTSALLYSSLIFSVIFDWLFFHNIPNIFAWIGIFFVFASSGLIVYSAKKKY